MQKMRQPKSTGLVNDRVRFGNPLAPPPGSGSLSAGCGERVNLNDYGNSRCSGTEKCQAHSRYTITLIGAMIKNLLCATDLKVCLKIRGPLVADN